jgi:4-amino-4-deoxy-L-arabinose transferase-like glycosyltransferase
MKHIQNFLREHRTVILVIGLAALIPRLILFGLFLERGVYDSWKFDYGDGIYYTQVAKNILAHGTISIDLGEPPAPDSLRTPLYSFFLIPIFYFHLPLAFFVFLQNILGALLVVFLYVVLRRLFTHRVAFIVSLAVALEPYWIFLSNRIIAEPLFVPLFVGAHLACLFFLIHKRDARYLYLAAALFGLAALTRPVGFYFFIFVPLLLILGLRGKVSLHHIIQKIVIASSCFLIILAPWFIRNRITLHSWSISSVQEYNLFNFNGKPFCEWLGDACDAEFRTAIEKLPEKFDQDFAKEYKAAGISLIRNHLVGYALFSLQGMPSLFLNNAYVDILQILSDQPLYTERSFWAVFTKPTLSSLREYIGTAPPGVVFVLVFGKFLLIVLTVLAMSAVRLLFVKQYTHKGAIIFLIASIALYTVLSTPIGSPRLRTPIFPTLVLLATLSTSWHYGWYRRLRQGGKH